MNEFAKLLSSAMAERNLNANQLANRAGIPRQTVYRLLDTEGGDGPEFATVVKIARALEVSLESFVWEGIEPTPQAPKKRGRPKKDAE